MTGDGVFAATWGIGHIIVLDTGAGVETFAFVGCWCATTGDACEERDVEAGRSGGLVPLFALAVVGVACVLEVSASVPGAGSVSRRRFMPRVELSFMPILVALMRIWCLVLPGPHALHTQSQSISWVSLCALLSSASFFNLSVSSSDHAP